MNALVNPSPSEYADINFKLNKRLGKSFGLGYDVYKRLENKLNVPGPG